MTPEQQIKQLSDFIDRAIGEFNDRIPSIQNGIVAELELLLRELKLTTNGQIAASVSNLKVINRIKSKLENFILSEQYTSDVSKYISAFDGVAKMQSEYFKTIESSFKPSEFLRELKSQSVDSTLSSLTNAGIDVNFIEPIAEMLRVNVRTGSTFVDMMSQLREFVAGNDENVGHLSRYVKQLTTDSLNQFSATYNETVASDLGLNWFQYSGGEIVTSRPFCVGMVQKRFFHRSEVPKLINGDFPEFIAAGGTIYKKTGLPDGMVAGTNAATFFVYRGGWNCRHLAIPITETNVPKSVRVAVYTLAGIRFDDKGFAIAA